MPAALKYRDGLKPEVACMDKEEYQLPKQLKQLYEQFCEIDKVAVLKFRTGTFSLEDVKKSILLTEKSVARERPLPRVTEETIGRILHLYPESYAVEWMEEKSKTQRATSTKYVFKIRPMLIDDLDGFYEEQKQLPLTPKKGEPRPMTVPVGLISPVKGARKQPNMDYIPKSPTKSPVKPLMRPACAPDRVYFQPWRRDCRRLIFKYKLYNYLREEHEKYLRKRGIETNNNDAGKPLLFDREFDFDSIPPVPMAALPEPPKPLTQKSLLDFLKSPTTKQATPPPKPLGPRAQMRELAAATKAPVKSPPAAVKLTPRSKGKLSFEQVTVKQEVQETKEATSDQKAEQRAVLLEKLHTKVLPLLSSQYSKQVSRRIGQLFSTLKYSLSDLKLEEFKKMSALLVEITPQHFCIETVSRQQHLKLTSNNNSEVFGEIPKLVEAELKTVRQMIDPLKQ